MFHLARKPRPLRSDEEANIKIIKDELELRQKPAIRLLHTHSNDLIAALKSYVLSEPIPRKTNTSTETYKNLLNIYAASVDAEDYDEMADQLRNTSHLSPLFNAHHPPVQPDTTSRSIRARNSRASRIRTARYARRMLSPNLLLRIPPPFPTSPEKSNYRYSLRQTHFYPTTRESHLVHCATLEDAHDSLAGYAAVFEGRKVLVRGIGRTREVCWVQDCKLGDGWGFDVFVGQSGREKLVTQIRVRMRAGAVVEVGELRTFLEGLTLE